MKKIIITLSLLTALNLSAIAAEEGTRPQRPERPDPTVVAGEWIATYDVDSSKSLNAAELATAMEAARADRPQMGNRQQRPQRPQGDEQAKRPERPERPERAPGQMTGRFIERFDTDGDKALNEGELKVALTEMGNQQGRRGGPRGPRSGERPAKAPAANAEG